MAFQSALATRQRGVTANLEPWRTQQQVPYLRPQGQPGRRRLPAVGAAQPPRGGMVRCGVQAASPTGGSQYHQHHAAVTVSNTAPHPPPSSHTSSPPINRNGPHDSPVLAGGSHTRVLFPNTAPTCFGCYSIHGPAVIHKRGDFLVARLYEGATVSLFYGHDGEDTVVFTHDQLCADGSEVGECILVGTHVQLDGVDDEDFGSCGEHEGLCLRHGKRFVSVRALPNSSVIVLRSDGELRHPLNMQPEDVDRN